MIYLNMNVPSSLIAMAYQSEVGHPNIPRGILSLSLCPLYGKGNIAFEAISSHSPNHKKAYNLLWEKIPGGASPQWLLCVSYPAKASHCSTPHSHISILCTIGSCQPPPMYWKSKHYIHFPWDTHRAWIPHSKSMGSAHFELGLGIYNRAQGMQIVVFNIEVEYDRGVK